MCNFSAPDKESLLDDTSPSESKTKTDQIPEKDERKMGGHEIKHISGNLNSDDLYALPNKKNKNHVDEMTAEDECDGVNNGDDDDGDENQKENGKKEEIEDKDGNSDLPPGWEKHEGNFLLKQN